MCVRACACVHACACMRAGACACVHACACMRACLRACMRACVLCFQSGRATFSKVMCPPSKRSGGAFGCCVTLDGVARSCIKLSMSTSDCRTCGAAPTCFEKTVQRAVVRYVPRAHCPIASHVPTAAAHTRWSHQVGPTVGAFRIGFRIWHWADATWHWADARGFRALPRGRPTRES